MVVLRTTELRYCPKQKDTQVCNPWIRSAYFYAKLHNKTQLDYQINTTNNRDHDHDLNKMCQEQK